MTPLTFYSIVAAPMVAVIVGLLVLWRRENEETSYGAEAYRAAEEYRNQIDPHLRGLVVLNWWMDENREWVLQGQHRPLLLINPITATQTAAYVYGNQIKGKVCRAVGPDVQASTIEWPEVPSVLDPDIHTPEIFPEIVLDRIKDELRTTTRVE